MSIRQLPSGIEVRIRQDLSEGSRGETTLIIDPIITKSGHRVTMDDIGIRGFGKIDANNPREEIISWTGITDNTSTYTLTGVVWGVNFHNSTGNFTDNMKRHISGAKFSINTDMHYIADNYVNKRDFNVTDNSIGWGDGTKDENKVLEARNGTANLPFIVYNETVDKWLISNDGINTYDIVAGGGGLVAGIATLINSGAIDVQVGDASGVQVVDNKINIVYQTNPGLEVDASNELGVKIKEDTGLIKDADGLYCDSIDPDNPVAQTPAQLIGDTFNSFEVDVLLVGGGGGAGRGSNSTTQNAGGGGAGGLIIKENASIASETSTITIGDGGSASSSYSIKGSNGENSTALGLTVFGGGGGGSISSLSGSDGGSGGGAAANGTLIGSGGIATQIGTDNYGNDGGSSASTGLAASGGGASAVGTTAGFTSDEEAGGAGLEVWGTTYATGGNGCDSNSTNGDANTGDGGNAGPYNSDVNGGSGGSGVCVIRYKTTDAAGKTITGGTITTAGEYTYHTFTSDGSFNVSDIYDNLQNFVDLGEGDNNGKFSINIDGVDYNDIAIDLSGIQGLHDVATLVQTAIRAETGNNETVVWSTDKFIITGDNPSQFAKILKLTPPTTGTDISGAGYLDLGANATEVAGDGDDYKLVRLDEDGQVPVEILSSFSEEITEEIKKKTFGTANYNLAANPATKTTITHELGKIPTFLRLTTQIGTDLYSYSVSDGTTIATVFTPNGNAVNASTFVLYSNTGAAGFTGVISKWDATEIEITWTLIGTYFVTARMVWEVE